MNVREWALPVYTILIQLAAGSFLFLWLVRLINPTNELKEDLEEFCTHPTFIIMLTILVAMIGSHFHLSKPFFSFLAMSNFSSSWLSREIVFTVLFFLMIFVLSLLQTYSANRYFRMNTIMGFLAIIFSFFTIYCMAKVYLLPTQTAWNTHLTILSFFGTSVLLGLTSLALMLVLDLKLVEIKSATKFQVRKKIIEKILPFLTISTVVVSMIMLLTNYLQIYYLNIGDESARLSLRLIIEIYLILFGLRHILIIVGGVWLLISINQIHRQAKTVNELIVPFYVSSLFILIGEILGRFLFYATHVRTGL